MKKIPISKELKKLGHKVVSNTKYYCNNCGFFFFRTDSVTAPNCYFYHGEPIYDYSSAYSFPTCDELIIKDIIE
jgi:predicted Zn-ribbon and HTH transcriptional regulator